jgi:hypothetical protein
MKKFAELLPIALLVIFSSLAYSQSLGDLANKEKERRAEVINDKVITDEEAAKYSSGSETVRSAGDKTSAQSGIDESAHKTSDVASEKKKDSESEESADFQGKTESYWRKTMRDARQSVKNLENEANVLVLKLNKLQDQFYKEADGYRRETVQREIQKTYYEQDLNKTNLEKARAALQDLEKEARKSGALPGWIENREP